MEAELRVGLASKGAELCRRRGLILPPCPHSVSGKKGHCPCHAHRPLLLVPHDRGCRLTDPLPRLPPRGPSRGHLPPSPPLHRPPYSRKGFVLPMDWAEALVGTTP